MAAKPKTTRAWFVCFPSGEPIFNRGFETKREAEESKLRLLTHPLNVTDPGYKVQQFTLTPVRKKARRK